MDKRAAADASAVIGPVPDRANDAVPDESLMERYRDGDAAAFEPLYRRHRGGVYRYLLRQCGQRAVADELFQDVWMNLIRARTGYRVEARFTTWLYRIAHNRLIDHYRATPHGLPASFDDEAGPSLDSIDAGRTADPAVQVESRQQVDLLLQWIRALPDAQREAFLMQQEGGMTVDEIALATGVGRETAKSRLRYAIARLRAACRAAVASDGIDAARIGEPAAMPAPGIRQPDQMTVPAPPGAGA